MDPISVSFTQFIDYLKAQSTSAKMSMVSKVKYQEEYSVAKDFYKNLRDGIVDFHKNNRSDDYLDDIISSAGNSPAKMRHYQSAINGYKKFLKTLKNKKVEYIELDKSFWAYTGLVVRSTPELCLLINDVPHRIKLYFKDEDKKITKKSLTSLLALMSESITNKPYGNERNCLLNVKAGVLDTLPKPTAKDINVLKMEAIIYGNMWDNL